MERGTDVDRVTTTGGCNAPPRCSSTRRGLVAMRLAAAGWWTTDVKVSGYWRLVHQGSMRSFAALDVANQARQTALIFDPFGELAWLTISSQLRTHPTA